MAKKPHLNVTLTGPLFDDGIPDKVRDAIAGVVEKKGDEASGVLMGFIQAGGFVRTGGFLHSVDSEYHRHGHNIGYAKVYPTETWGGTITMGHSGVMTKGKRGRGPDGKLLKVRARMTVQSVHTAVGGPTRTWFETGNRRGKRLRTGIYGFRKTTARLQSMAPENDVAKAVMAVIE